MPKVAIVIPYRDRGVDSLRKNNLDHVLNYWAKFGCPVVVAGDGREGDAQFNRSAAYNRGSAATDADILAYIESDTLIPYKQVDAAIEHAATRPGLVIPFTHQKKLTAEDSVLVRGGLKEAADCVPAPHPYGETTNYGCANVLSRRTLEAVGQWDEVFCVDEETEILTSQGWRHRCEVKVGDMVLTLNHISGLSEWQPVEAVNVFPGVHEMLSIESTTHSSLTTLNHRWPVIREQNKRTASGDVTHYEWRAWKTTTTFTTADHVPIAADCADLPTEQKYTDALVECVAWFWTEGGVARLRDGRLGRGVVIAQSSVVNPDNCDRIASALTRAFGPASAFTRRNKSKADMPRWKTQPNVRNLNFVLNAEAGEILQALAPNRVPSSEFLMSLTQAQLLLFIETSLLGDGATRSRPGHPLPDRVLGQKDPAAAEAFQFACILAGIPTSIYTNPVMPRYGYGMTNVRLRNQRRFKLANGTHQRMTMEGIVWCPTTSNTTWLARRRGKVYFTGNSGHGHDDNAMFHAFQVVARPVRWVEGDCYHLYHLDFDPDTTPDRSYLSAEDVAAQERNRRRLELYRCAKTPDEIRLLTSGTPTDEWLKQHWGRLNWRIRSLASEGA